MKGVLFMSTQQVRVALFDFDQTFYKYETFSLLQNHLKHDEQLKDRYRRFFNPTFLPYMQYKMKLMQPEKARRIAMQNYSSALDGLSEEDVRSFFRKLKPTIEEGINKQLAQLVEENAKNGIRSILVSGAFIPFLEEVTSDYAFDAILGSHIPFVEGKVDGEATITHVQSDLKVNAIHDTLHDVDVDWENSFAFSDRYSDLPMLELVGNPAVVNAEPRLKKHALERGWIYIDA